MNTANLQESDGRRERLLFMAMELSAKSWKLVLSDGIKRRRVTVDSGNLAQLRAALDKSRERFHLSVQAEVVSCYEAGRDGFWIHRYLESIGINNLVVDSSSIEVNRRHRRAKTDRIDAEKLLSMLIRHQAGEQGVWSVVHVPSVENEDARRVHRELERLKKERTAHRNRLRGLLVAQGVRIAPGRDFLSCLARLRLWDGSPLPKELKGELEREYRRLELVKRQIAELEASQQARLKEASDNRLQKVRQLMGLKGIGKAGAWVLVMEFFAWRAFGNRREVAVLAGLTGMPYTSGDSEREQGISKAGNRRIRALSIELAWCWLRYQPNSELTQWFEARYAKGGKRLRRIGIVALARRLLVALWRYLEHGVVPPGAQLKATAAVTAK